MGGTFLDGIFNDPEPRQAWINAAINEIDRWAEEYDHYQDKTYKLNWKYIMENDESKEQINLNIQAEDGQVEIIHRYGNASEIQEPQRVDIAGSIEAPGEYYELRKEVIDRDKAHLEVYQNKGKIILSCDPHSPIGATIIGDMKVNPLLAKMKINNFGSSKRNEDDFVLLLKETRQLFADPKVCMDIVDKVSNIEYKVNQDINKSDDERGSRKDFYEQHCETNLPGGFDLSTNIFVASKDETREHTFHVELKYHFSGQLYFWLESTRLQEIKEDAMEQMLAEQIMKFEGEIPIIYK